MLRWRCMSLRKSFCLKPPACLLLAGPQENAFNPVLESTDWYCQCLSPQTTKAFFCEEGKSCNLLPSYSKSSFAWLSCLLFRSGPTTGVGLISRRKVASESAKLFLNHAICSLPRMVLSGPSGILLGERKVTQSKKINSNVVTPLRSDTT